MARPPWIHKRFATGDAEKYLARVRLKRFVQAQSRSRVPLVFFSLLPNCCSEPYDKTRPTLQANFVYTDMLILDSRKEHNDVYRTFVITSPSSIVKNELPPSSSSTTTASSSRPYQRAFLTSFELADSTKQNRTSRPSSPIQLATQRITPHVSHKHPTGRSLETSQIARSFEVG